MTTHIIITAGGTSEPIDGVRRISNSSTGSLCACIYNALAEQVSSVTAHQIDCTGGESGFMVHYVVSSTAVRPEPDERLPISFYPVTDVASVLSVLNRLISEHKIAYVIHGMAVSDFTKGYLIEREALAEELAEKVLNSIRSGLEKQTVSDLRNTLLQVLEHPERAIDSSAKVSSQSELLLSLVKTPKLIEKIKQWDPSTCLVGFKLLKDVSEEELVRVAARLAEKNSCDFVLANDMTKIDANRHYGLLIKDGCIVGRYETKQEIARGIAYHMLGESFA